jgi:hypothetical protein
MLIEIEKDISKEEAIKIAERELLDEKQRNETVKKIKEKSNGREQK